MKVFFFTVPLGQHTAMMELLKISVLGQAFGMTYDKLLVDIYLTITDWKWLYSL